METLANYEDLEEQGLLLKLLCKMGDTIYTNISMQGCYFRKENRPYEAKIVFIGINGVDNFINADFGNGAMLQFKFSEIGKTVFLTQAEAEEALQKMERKEIEFEIGNVIQNISKPNVKVLITRKYADETYDGIDASGATFSGIIQRGWKKSGRHYDIETVLNKFKEES